MSDQLEFVKSYIHTLSSQPVTYPDTFQTPPEKKPRKAPLVSLPLADLPQAIESAPASQAHNDSISITIKSLKPALTFTLSDVSLSDPISTLKTQLGNLPDAPPPSHQRLLLKGKALVDSKLLKEYEIVEGSSLVLMIKAGWVPGSSTVDDKHGYTTETPPVNPTAKSAVPTLTISTDSSTKPVPLPISSLASGPAHTLPPSEASFHARLADPFFWDSLHQFARGHFAKEEEAEGFWEACLLGLKGKMTEGDVARARDRTGMTGMGGGIGI